MKLIINYLFLQKGNAVPQKEDEIKMVTSSETDTDINQQSIEVIKDVFESRLSGKYYGSNIFMQFDSI